METNGQKETENIQKMNCALQNLGTVNKNKVSININSKGTLKLYFSYETVVCFELNTPDKYMTETIQNYWGNTTGKLLNECQSDKTKRVNEEEFEKRLAEAFNILMSGSK